MNKLQNYHQHCHSRQPWLKGMTEPFPCDCGLTEAVNEEVEAYKKAVSKALYTNKVETPVAIKVLADAELARRR